jgi:hypothetical protein
MDLTFLWADLRARYPPRASWPLRRPFLCAFRFCMLFLLLEARRRELSDSDYGLSSIVIPLFSRCLFSSCNR